MLTIISHIIEIKANKNLPQNSGESEKKQGGLEKSQKTQEKEEEITT